MPGFTWDPTKAFPEANGPFTLTLHPLPSFCRSKPLKTTWTFDLDDLVLGELQPLPPSPFAPS